MIEIKYEREVSHCEKTPYAKLVTIDSITPAQNSDNLDIVKFKEMGWNAICQKGIYNIDDKVMFIPPESVIPIELGEKLNITKYLSKGKVKVTRLRGNRSEGIIVPIDIVSPYINYILKWEDLPDVSMFGDVISPTEVNIDFIKFYKMPNILNEPFTFKMGEEIFYSEKIHGTNFRFGNFRNPFTQEYQYYIGGHNLVFKESKINIYLRMFDKFLKSKNLPEDIQFFAEIFGLGVQDLKYNLNNQDFKIFAATRKGYYISIPELIEISKEYDLQTVNFHKTIFENIEQLRILADLPSEIAEGHIREGIVVVSKDFPERMAKCIGFNYLTRKNKNKTEKH